MKYTSKWMNPENIMVTERSQTHKTSYCMILFHELLEQGH